MQSPVVDKFLSCANIYNSTLLIQMEDTLWSGLTDSHIGLPMGITAENLADKYNISREDCDELAFVSQERWAKGWWGLYDRLSYPHFLSFGR